MGQHHEIGQTLLAQFATMNRSQSATGYMRCCKKGIIAYLDLSLNNPGSYYYRDCCFI